MWKGKDYRFSLDRHVGRPLSSRAEAESEAERIRRRIREVVRKTSRHRRMRCRAVSFAGLADVWQRRYGHTLVSAMNDSYWSGQIKTFQLVDRQPNAALGDVPADAVTLLDVEAYRDYRRAAGLSAVSIKSRPAFAPQDFSWGIRKGVVARTPFKVGTEPAVQLEREIPCHRRFDDVDDERRLLDASTPHLHAIVVGLLETACRVGEVLSLQWRDVSLERRELTVRAEKAKTRTARVVP